MSRKSPELSTGCKESIVAMVRNGQSFGEVARLLNLPKSTVYSVWKKFSSNGSVENGKRSGRKYSINEHAARRLIRQMKGDRKKNLKVVTADYNNNNNVQVSQKTVWRRLRQFGFRRCVCKKKIRIRVANRVKRVRWCREKRNWTVQGNWKHVIFSDESQIVIGDDNRIYVWRKSDEAWLPECISPGVNRRLSVMIWGSITYNGVGTLSRVNGTINSDKYIEILENNLWPVIARHFPDDNYIFMDDNAPVHRSRVTKAYIEENDIHGMEWPAQSPDLNPIENVWLTIKRKLQFRVNEINTVDDLYAKISEIWTSFSVDYIQSLYHSIPKRIRKVQRARGYITKY